jgi:hypothetical protein
MTDAFPPAVQRQALLELARALGCCDSALRRDECGGWRISGRHGHIYAAPGSLERPRTPGLQIVVLAWTARGWNAARKALEPFAHVTGDGNDEGMLFLDRLAARHRRGVGRQRARCRDPGRAPSAGLQSLRREALEGGSMRKRVST